MKILVDIGHPAHVHYFRNFIKIMEGEGNEFLICARDKDVTQGLLKEYQINYTSRGKGRKSIIGKLIYLLYADYKLFKLANQFIPDIILSFGSAYAAHISKLLRVPHIAFDDTEHAKLEHLLYAPFTECILTPYSFKKHFGEKHIKFAGSMDMAYLHPKYYKTDNKYLEELKLKDKKYFFLRFINWTASHDLGQSGFSIAGKKKLINLLAGYGDVLISSEVEMPHELNKYLYKGNPSQIHSVLENSLMFISESGSMATEAAILGTPSVMVNTSAKYFGVFEYISKFGNLFYFDDENQAIEKIECLLSIKNLKEISIQNSHKYFSTTINLTDFMVWFLKNYPKSFEIIKKNPDYQFNFK